MSCASCALRIEQKLRKLPGVIETAVNFATENTIVEYDDQETGREALEETVKSLGFEVIPTPAQERFTENQVKLQISGMTCAACATKIERKLNKSAGVAKTAVNLGAEQANV